MNKRYYIQHRHLDGQFLEIFANKVFWTTILNDADFFDTAEEAKKEALEYSNGDVYGWIGLEKGFWIGSFEFEPEQYISEDAVDAYREAERNGNKN